MTKTVLILGASGKIGSHSAEAFWNAGWTVRKFDRATGDMRKAAEGADVIINGMNPANYKNWDRAIPQITRDVIDAAKHSGASVIIPGNIYNFGDQPGTLSETTPHLATTRKGKIRIEMEEAYRASSVQTIVLRAGNFIDPMQNGDILSLVLFRSIKSGKVTLPGPADTQQAYAYVPDWARAAVILAEKRDALATFEDIPFPGHAFTYEELRQKTADALGRKVTFTAFPWWLMTLAAPVWGLAYEMKEMRYQYTMDHTLDGVKFTRLLPEFKPTDRDTVMTTGLRPQVDPHQTVRAGGEAVGA